MSEYAPASIYRLYSEIHHLIPSAELSGIQGDKAHGYGYHRARSALPSSDYSVKLGKDREGNANACSALDVKLPAALMRVVSARLRAAMIAKDPRVTCLREFGGTLDGRVTFARDRWYRTESYGSWDDSHLWHVHLSIFRAYADNWNAIKGVAEVMAGVKMTAGQKATSTVHKVLTPSAPKATKWALPAGHFYGLITGPANCHGGINVTERAAVKRIQSRLQVLGYAPKVSGWADGKYEAATKSAVIRWQKATKRRATGTVQRADWVALKV